MRMNKDPFEQQLETLFAGPPRFDDAAAFTARFEQRLAWLARWRADIMTAVWIVAGGAVLFALVSTLDDATVAAASAALTAAQDLGGAWLLPVLAVAAVLTLQLVEDQLARD
jgi:hypothetical protein